MTWVKLDDGFMEHPKIIGLSPAALCLHVAGLCYSARNMTDGYIAASRPKLLTSTYKAKLVVELVDAGVWDEFDDGWMIHDFLEFNPSKAKVESDRAYNARRQAMHKDHGLRDRIKNRDQDMCRYCGTVVKWTDRKGPHGGTYDHVIPRGPNTEENLVVACRGCNSSKGNKSLEQWGVELRPVPGSDLGRDLDHESGSVKKTRPDPTRSIDPSVKDFSGGVDEPVEREVVDSSLASARAALHALPRRAS